ncbi:choline transporter-like protein 1 [Copidosoma floridanum]|uniref:choline transporter-like protein 1 n=1 Tax=Copidosoma floridanum TaxID=29053 RepID=UPI0006C9416B|nr:choline transporter-like protein 1 [Copidosoma floridanum]
MTYSVIAGEKSKQEPVWNGPLDTARTDTDVSFLALFATLMFVWLLVSVYAFVAGDVLQIHYSNNFRHREVLELSYYLYENLYRARYIVITFVTLTTLLLAGYVTLFRYATKALLLTTVFLMVLLLVVDYVFIGLYLANHDDYNYSFLLIDVAVSVALAAVVYAFKKIGTDMVCKVIKESCKAMFFFPSTLLFTFCQFLVHLCIVVYALAVCEFLRAIKVPDAGFEPRIVPSWNDSGNSTSSEAYYDEMIDEAAPVAGTSPVYVYVMHVINVVCFFWASSFIAGLGRMVLTAAFATWYHAKGDTSNNNSSAGGEAGTNPAGVPNATLLKCFAAILSYHSGTIAYASSMVSVITMVDVVRKYGRDALKKMYKRPVLLMSWLTVLVKFSYDALAMCAIHGSPYYDSAKDSYVLLMKNPMSYLAVNTVSECVIFIGLLLAPVLSICMAAVYVQLLVQTDHFIQPSVIFAAILMTVIISVLMSLTCFMVFRAASNTIRCCVLEDSKFNHEAEMKVYVIHVDDASSVRDDGNGITVIRDDK